ncbi:MAG: hypothetical protein DRP11_02960 [Candidatus Aenigmatarchaeota archaeon]|nr:MAG: hypothetical protein DRP11_02960 [Candidatus Aenigmarchaeota archaeon]
MGYSEKLIFFTVLLLIPLSILTILVSGQTPPFNFTGFTRYTNGTPMPEVNITMILYNMSTGFNEIERYSTLSDSDGFFNLSNITFYEHDIMYKPIIIKYSSTNPIRAEYIGQTLPPFPPQELQNLHNVTFYLKEAATLNITAEGRRQHLDEAQIIFNQTIPDYSIGLEWDWDNGLWAYENSSHLVKLDRGFSYVSSFETNISSVMDIEYTGSDTWYFINHSTSPPYYTYVTKISGGSVVNYTNLTYRNYVSIEGLEYNPNDGLFYVSGRNQMGNTTIDKYNSSTFELIENLTLDLPPGKLEIQNGVCYLAGEIPETYALLKCDCNTFQCYDSWNFTKPTVDGLDYNGTWYFASRNDSSINEIRLFDDGTKTFRYQVKDTRLGYPVDENFERTFNQTFVYVPADRNYSIMIYPEGAMPSNYDLNNISDYGPSPLINIHFNVTEEPKWVYGYVTHPGTSNFDSFIVIPYLLEPGNMVFDRPMPYNMSAWRWPRASDYFNNTYNSTTCFYNMTIPGSAMGTNILLFAMARNESTGTGYFGAFKTLTVSASSPENIRVDFTLQPLVGTLSSISMEDAGNWGNTKYITTIKKRFRLRNASGTNAPGHAHIEMEMDYTSLGGPSFTWMTDVESDDNGIFEVLTLNAPVKRVNVYSQDFAPKKDYISVSELASDPTEILLNEFRPGGPGGETFTDIMIDMVKSAPECDVPNYDRGVCSLFPEQVDMEHFNPLSVIMGGGHISFVMRKNSNNITVHYVDVDMFASGPPDALFNDSASNDLSGSTLEQAWRFGSMGPEIYDYVIIGIPYTEANATQTGINDSEPITVNIPVFYDNDWNVTWQMGVNETTNLTGTDYEEYTQDPYAAYINGSNVTCNTTDTNLTGLCYADTVMNMIWLRIPHFSGIQPNVQGEALKANGESCTDASECYGGYCVHGYCRSSSTYCGDGYCEGGEDCDNCPSDCVCYTPPSSGGGGTGGTTTPGQSHLWTLITPGAAQIMKVNDPETGLKQIQITVKNQATNVRIRVVKLEGKPASIEHELTGKVYKYVQIEQENLNENLDKAYIDFAVPKSWIANNSIDPEKVYLNRYTNQWERLNTWRTGETDDSNLYRAETPGFSYFAITGETLEETTTPPAPEEESQPETQPETQPEETLQEEVTPEVTEKTGEEQRPFDPMILVWIIVPALIVLGVFYYLYQEQQKKSVKWNK